MVLGPFLFENFQETCPIINRFRLTCNQTNTVSPDLTFLDYFLWGQMKFRVCAERSNRGAELTNRTLNSTGRLRNDQEMVMRAVMSTMERVKMYVDNQGGRFGGARYT
jgi:hypothetical protein